MAVGAIKIDRIDELSGPQKVAVLLMAMGQENSTAVTEQLTPDEMEVISLEIARLDRIAPEVVDNVLDQWVQSERAAFSLAQGGVDYAKKLLENTYGSTRASQMLKRIESQLHDQLSLTHLRRADSQQLTALIQNEHPQLIALILAYLDTNQTAAILREMDPDLGGDVVARMAIMDKVLPDLPDGAEEPEILEARPNIPVIAVVVHGNIPESQMRDATLDVRDDLLDFDEITEVIITGYREREIVKLRYGVGDGYTYTLEEVGRIFKVTRERVRQVEAKAIRKLQHPVRSRKLASFVDESVEENSADKD